MKFPCIGSSWSISSNAFDGSFLFKNNIEKIDGYLITDIQDIVSNCSSQIPGLFSGYLIVEDHGKTNYPGLCMLGKELFSQINKLSPDN